MVLEFSDKNYGNTHIDMGTDPHTCTRKGKLHCSVKVGVDGVEALMNQEVGYGSQLDYYLILKSFAANPPQIYN